jgi:hypothetical protein
MDSTSNTNNFYNWFASNGGCLSGNFDYKRTRRPVLLQHNNLKSRAAEIKEKYNYQFIFKDEEHRGFRQICDRKKTSFRTIYSRFIGNGFWEQKEQLYLGFRKWSKSRNNFRNNGKNTECSEY